jgi:hypothetical protein
LVTKADLGLLRAKHHIRLVPRCRARIQEAKRLDLPIASIRTRQEDQGRLYRAALFRRALGDMLRRAASAAPLRAATIRHHSDGQLFPVKRMTQVAASAQGLRILG